MATEAAKKQASATIELENTSKRDFLRSIEQEFQEKWKKDRVFEVDSPSTIDNSLDTLTPKQLREKYPKYFTTFPFAYMNGSYHLGHAFTISKVDFIAGYERLKGKRVLFPSGYHCTGMPIKASADKLIREIEMFGEDFDKNLDTETTAVSATAPPAKSKVAAKSTGAKYQYQIMESIGVPRSEIKKFSDPQYWLKYFPPIAERDLTSFGCRIDWRRSFVTTDANPYYDTFVRWQIKRLHEQGHIGFGKRYTVYSPKDGQPCMDHDRASGENVLPQEYTALKMKVVEWPQETRDYVSSIIGNRNAYLVAATLRPETMYGQTNCFVGPSITYSIVEADDNSCYIITHRAARNMAYQGLLKDEGQIHTLGELKGTQLVGAKIHAPLSVYEHVYVLPMESVSAAKGTAVVTSVPSDSPDDFITYADIRKKHEFYKIDSKWIEHDPVPVLKTPTYGDMTAEALVKQLKIQSPKDVKALAEAKELAYKEGFYRGTMVIGSFKDEPVQVAKDKVKQELADRKEAFAYAEPESLVISRSADECVVALCDQWYMRYGNEIWKPMAEKVVAQMELFTPEVRHQFEKVLSWLREWACARSYGLGSQFPIDPKFLVESLSDSTIYMSYYTINHLLHGNTRDGSEIGPLGIKPEQMTDAVWDYVFSPTEPEPEFPANVPITKEQGLALRREFTYFYPLDMRSSGKDLIANHLTFCVYVHSALFAEEYWPRAMRANGHLMLNAAKMSKSTGNFLTLAEAVVKFGADASRIALAEAGDGIEDANFDEKVANAAIMRLRTLIDWCGTTVNSKDTLRSGDDMTFWDKIFDAEINYAIIKTDEVMTRTNFKEGLKHGFYDFQTSRDQYREACSVEGQGGMHRDLIMRWIHVQALLISPIAPHYAEYVWTKILGEQGSIHTAKFPEPSGPLDKAVLDSKAYVDEILSNFRVTETQLVKKLAKAKDKFRAFDPAKPKAAIIFLARKYTDWQDECISTMKSLYDSDNGNVDNSKLKEELSKKGLIKDKRVMQFCVFFQRQIEEFGPEIAFNGGVAFNEMTVLNDVRPHLKTLLGLQTLEIMWDDDIKARVEKGENIPGYDAALVSQAVPRHPSFALYNPVTEN